ncbi:MAG: NAD(P)-dependent alcohol dehydrogenase [Bacteroidales bacterium]|nr:NAD(P)-dependent alcohol dehydrogenase [Bacteroidales bacterium]MCB9013935.1 NAD(P)-dependent alcohol dehydrogenase [Bacteroidales bacterium]
MKAAIIKKYGGPEVITIADIPRPVPGPKEVLIKIHAVSINPVDWKIRKGNLKMLLNKKFPKILGIEFSGVIEETGADVKNLKKGQRVFAGKGYEGGGYAEYAVADESRTVVLPDNISFEEASTMAVAGMTALQGLRNKGKIKAGMDVIVNGASGGVGTYAVQIAKVLGAKVTAVCSARNFDLVKSLGADVIIDYKETDFTRLPKKYNIVFDAVGYRSFWQTYRVLKKRGIYVNISPSFPLYITSMITRLNPGRKSKGFMLHPDMDDLREVMNMIATKKIKVIIDKTFPLEKMAEAHSYSETERARGKIVVVVEH